MTRQRKRNTNATTTNQKCILLPGGRNTKQREVQTMVATPVRMVRAPRGRRLPRNAGVGMPKVSFQGSDVIGIVQVPEGSQVGVSFFNQALNPLALTDSRLKQHAKLYARWRPISLTAQVVGSGSANTFGSIAVGWSPDGVASIIGKDISNLNRTMSCRPSKIARMNQTVSLNIPSATSRKWYMCNGPADDANHGVLNVVCASTTGGYKGNTTFSVHLHWRVEFEGAELSSAATEEDVGPDR